MFPKKKQIKKDKLNKNTLHNPKILDVNLVKGEIGVSFDWRKNISTLILVLLITALFIAEIYFGLDWWAKQENLRAQTLENNVAQVSREVRQLRTKTDKALAYQSKTIELDKLLTQHVYWTNFFNWLERKTLSSVSYGNFKGDLTGKYALQATTKNFSDISWQVKSFLNDPLTEKAVVNDAEMSTDRNNNNNGIDFIINLKVKPTIFKK